LPTRIDHLAVAANDKQRSATFLTDLLGLPEPTGWGPFLSVTLDDGVRLDYAEPGIDFPGQHYALRLSDDVFDYALERIKSAGLPFWGGPGHSHGEINTTRANIPAECSAEERLDWPRRPALDRSAARRSTP
jgi:catechol 2,3-dioxygenase-like lactoylglutathione lyase family enzyme